MVGVQSQDSLVYLEWSKHVRPRMKDIIEVITFYYFTAAPEWRPEEHKHCYLQRPAAVVN